ncbi:VOC family protein [Candidatus Woesebacteria bacterium]|nr:VOC family protein [Candidatus Woesebacteria bacterium]
MNNNKIQWYRILLWSQNPDKLKQFYTDVLGLEEAKHLDISDDYGFLLKLNDTFSIWIGKHSKVTEKNRDPLRHMINFYVDDVFVWYEKMKDCDDVEIIQEPMVTPPTRESADKRYVFTMLDPEDNCLQFMNP